MAFSSEAARGLNKEREVGEKRFMSFLVADRRSPCRIKISIFRTSAQRKRKNRDVPSLITIVSGRGPLFVAEMSLNLLMCSDAEFID